MKRKERHEKKRKISTCIKRWGIKELFLGDIVEMFLLNAIHVILKIYARKNSHNLNKSYVSRIFNNYLTCVIGTTHAIYTLTKEPITYNYLNLVLTGSQKRKFSLHFSACFFKDLFTIKMPVSVLHNHGPYQ